LASDPAMTNSFALQWGFSGASFFMRDFDTDLLNEIGAYRNGYWYLHTPASDTTIAWATNLGYAGATAVPADFNADGSADLAVWDTSNARWYIRTLTGTVLAWGKQWGWNGAWPVPADYNGDTNTELAVYNSYNGKWYIQTMSSNVLAWGRGWGRHRHPGSLVGHRTPESVRPA
jgi:hypothetical protein